MLTEIGDVYRPTANKSKRFRPVFSKRGHPMASYFLPLSDEHRELEDTGQDTRDTTWSCHGQPIKFFCKYHVVAICHQCATENHATCTLDNIEDLMKELNTNQQRIGLDVEETSNLLSDLIARIQSCNEIAETCLASLRRDVENAYDDQIEKEMKIKREKERVINEDADEKIRIINEERETKLRLCYQFVDKLITPMEQQKSEILEDITRIEERLKTLEKEFEVTKERVRKMGEEIRKLKRDDSHLVKNTRQVLKLLRRLQDQDGCESAMRLEQTLKSLKFIKGYINSSFCGRLEFPSGQWLLTKTIEVQTIENPVSVPKFVGLVGYDCIAVMNHDPTDLGLYVIDLSQGTSTRVVEGQPNTYFVSCSSIDGNRVVCGKCRKGCTGDILKDCVTIHDETWKQLRSIPIPRNVTHDYAYVDVDPEGKILAGLFGESTIHVINPDDGEIEETITFLGSGKEICGRIHALSNGSVIARSGECEVTVIARTGATKSFIYDEGHFSLFRSETLSDAIYVTNWNKTSCRCTVGEMSSDGVIKAKGLVGYNDPCKSFYRSACLLTPSRKLVLCDEKRILVYTKECVL